MARPSIVSIVRALLVTSGASATTQRRNDSPDHNASPAAPGVLDELFRLRGVVENQNACAIPGCTIKYDSFLTCMWRAVSRGYVKQWDAEFVANGLRNGFDCGVQQSLAKGRRVFRNYPSAVSARSAVTKAISSRLGKGKSLALGPWAAVEAALKVAGIYDNDGFYDFFKYGASARRQPIDALEGDVVRRACAERGPMWAGCLVDWRIDNSAFQLSVAKSRSRAERLNDIIRDIMYLQLKYGFVLDTSVHTNALVSRDY